MEVALEFEDDLFFADLSKQISLLIMDDDEIPISNWNPSSLQPQGFSETTPNQQAQASSLYEQSCRREISKGTGVFIPKLSQPRRKGNRQGRYPSFNSRSSYRQISDTTRGPLSHNNNNSNNSSYSFNPKKHYYVPN